MLCVLKRTVSILTRRFSFEHLKFMFKLMDSLMFLTDALMYANRLRHEIARLHLFKRFKSYVVQLTVDHAIYSCVTQPIETL